MELWKQVLNLTLLCTSCFVVVQLYGLPLILAMTQEVMHMFSIRKNYEIMQESSTDLAGSENSSVMKTAFSNTTATPDNV